MADVKISALPAVVTPAGTDLVPVVQGGVTKGETVTQILGIRPLSPLLVNADVAAAAAIAGTKVAPDFGAQTITTTGSANIGTAPYAATGRIRFPYNVGSLVVTRDSGGGDAAMLRGTTDVHFFGSVAGTNVCGSGGVALCDATDTPVFSAKNTGILSRFAITGDAAGNSPYGAHGKINDATAPPFTVAAATYANEAIKLTNAGAGIVTFPTATDATAYTKTIINTGAGAKTIAQAAGVTVSLTTGLVGRFLFDAAGVHLVGATVAWV